MPCFREKKVELLYFIKYLISIQSGVNIADVSLYSKKLNVF